MKEFVKKPFVPRVCLGTTGAENTISQILSEEWAFIMAKAKLFAK